MGIVIRPLEGRDSSASREILCACDVFTSEEVLVALELVDEGVATGLAGPFSLFGAEREGILRGYICVGRVALTRGTWHLYWIAVHPSVQAQGIGRALQAHAEAFIRSLGGERLVLETSSRADYARTRAFYQAAGFAQCGLIPDFYRSGDDCMIFCKVLRPPA